MKADDDLNAARGIIYGSLMGLFIWCGAIIALTIYDHASQPEPAQTCENYYGNEVSCP